MSQGRKTEKRSTGRGGRLRAYFGFAVSIICIWWVFSSVESERVFERIKSADLGWIALAFITTFGSYVVRSLRWPSFFHHKTLKYGDSFRCLIIGFFMNNVLPMRIGELVRAHLGGRAAKQSRSTVLATIFGERLADALAISLLFALLFTFASGARDIQRGAELYYVAYFFLFAALVVALVLVARRRIFALLEKLGTVMPGHLSTYTLSRVRLFIEGLEPLLQPRSVLVLGLWSVLVWLIELLVYYQVACAFGYGAQMSIGDLSLFLAAVNFSSLVPAAPGAIGVIEAFATEALVRIGVVRDAALAMVVVQHVIQYIVVGIPGVFFFFFRLGGKIPEPEEEPSEEGIASAEARFVDVSEPRPQVSHVLEQIEPESQQGEEVEVSVIIPAFNEESRLPKTLLSVTEYFDSREQSYEVLVVDDGSVDGTSDVVRQYGEVSPSIRLLVYPGNRGKGYAVRFGVANALGRQILYADADGAAPIEELERLREALACGADVAIGSRAMYSMETRVETVWYRRVLGRIFSALVNTLILPGIADTQCGFKLFSRSAGKFLFPRQTSTGFSFDVELLFLARKAGFRIAEVPINWTNIPGSKVNLASDSMKMLLDIICFRLRDVFGGYGNLEQERD